MINRIRTLTILQLKNKKNKKAKTKTSTTVSIVLQVAICFLMIIGLYFLLDYIKQLAILPIDSNFFLFMLFITQAIGVLTCVFGLANFLYLSKDNTVIFSLPASPSEIFISKLAVFYITEFKKNLFFLLPFFIAFGIVLKLNFLFYIFVAFMIFLLPFLPVLIGAIFSLPLMYIKKLFKKYSILKIITILLIAGLVMWGIIYLVQIIPRPLRILAIYQKFFIFIKDTIISINQFSTIYQVIANIMLNNNIFINILIFLAIFISLVGVCIGIAFAYFKIASQSFEYATKTKKHKNNEPIKNTFWVFVKKEIILNIRNAETFASHILFVVSLPVLLYVVNEIISAIDTNLNGLAIAFAVNIFIGLMFLMTINTLSASAITSEGSEFGLIKTAPSETYKICYAKLMVNFFISLLGIISSIIVLAISTKFNFISILLIFLTFLLVNTAHMFWSLQLDLLKPRLLEYASSGSLRDNKNVGTSLLIGMGISIVFALVGFFCFQGMNLINMLKLPVIAGLFFAVRLYLFQLNIKVYFNRIQM